MSKNRTSRFMPVIVAVSIVTGILIGTFYANHFSGNRYKEVCDSLLNAATQHVQIKESHIAK